METIIELITPILLALASAGVAAVLAWLQAKTSFDIPASVQVKAQETIADIIMRVEGMAKDRAGSWDSESKLRQALMMVENLRVSQPEVYKAVRGKAESMIESLLISRLTPDEVTPHGDTEQPS